MNANSRPIVPALTLESRIKRALRAHLRALHFERTEDGKLNPPDATKDTLRGLHRAQLNDRLRAERRFIGDAWPRLQSYFANGADVDPSRIAPRLELIDAATWQSDLFRLASLTWSVPVSRGYGRRLRFLVWDESNAKLIGLIALADPVFNLRVRDEYVAWSIADRTARLVNVLDAYVLGALPPYSSLLGGKLVASLVGTTEVRDAFRLRYANTRGIISRKLKNPSLVMVTTSSALGRSSVYNRLRLGDYRLFHSLGFTSGWGHFHIPDRLFANMRNYLRACRHRYAENHQYGDGPNWRLRAVRECLTQIGMNPDLLRHGVLREVFACELAVNARAVLAGRAKRPRFAGLPTVSELGRAARLRWIEPRAARCPDFLEWHRDHLLDRLLIAKRRCTGLVPRVPMMDPQRDGARRVATAAV